MSEETGGATQGGEVCTFTAFKKKNRKGNLRKRDAEDIQEVVEAGSSVIRTVKAKKDGALDFKSSKGTSERDGKRFTYSGDRTIQQDTDCGATRHLEIETETDRDARALREQVLKQQAEGEEYDPKVYKGMNNYRDYRAGFRREHTIASEKGGGAHGPIRANTTIRGTFIMDYKPDLCKDYKETGYCGYGDSCKFMHDRGDYKSGWELDREWDEKEKQRKAQEALKAMNGEEESEEEEDDALPFACFICRELFVNISDPVKTKCSHFFCEHCALKHHANSKLCYVCQEPTGGVFNTAKEIITRTKQLKEKEKQKEKAREEDEDDEGLKEMRKMREKAEQGSTGIAPVGQSGGWFIP